MWLALSCIVYDLKKVSSQNYTYNLDIAANKQKRWEMWRKAKKTNTEKSMVKGKRVLVKLY